MTAKAMTPCEVFHISDNFLRIYGHSPFVSQFTEEHIRQNFHAQEDFRADGYF
jgi:hypothetical protein